MARFRNLRPINRIKHVVDQQTAVPKNAILANTLILASDTPSLGSPSLVETGSTVNGFYITIEIVASENVVGSTPNFYLSFQKNPGGNLVLPQPNIVGTSDNKKFVFHQEMVMLENVQGGNPRNVFKGVIAIPKHMRRFGPNDRIEVSVFIPSTGVDVVMCYQAHFKEFR